MTRTLVAAIALVLARPALAEGPASDCCIINADAGCDDADCEAVVCAVDSYCCDVRWDWLCAREAGELCEICPCCPTFCGDPLAGDCAVPHDNPGCDEAVCCGTVCQIDASCCQSDWDAACAQLAIELCTSPGGGCCFADDCVDMFQHECDAAGGTFQGAGSTCAELSCLQVAFTLDVRPGVCPNVIDPADPGVLPVAVVGTAVLPISAVDATTLELRRIGGGGSLAPATVVTADVATPLVDPDGCDCTTLAGDGIPDLLLTFPIPDVAAALALDAPPPSGILRLEIHGRRTDGDPFEAGDCAELPGACLGDTNGDHVVDVFDLVDVILDWGTDGSAHGGDVVGFYRYLPPDGLVGIADLVAVIEQWGGCGGG